MLQKGSLNYEELYQESRLELVVVLSDDSKTRVERFERFVSEWVSKKWKTQGKRVEIVGRCRAGVIEWMIHGDLEERLFADFLATFLDEQGELAKECFRYARGWKGASQDPDDAGQKVVEYLVRQKKVFGPHKRRTNQHDFPKALATYVKLAKTYSSDERSPSQVCLFEALGEFDSLYEEIKRNVTCFGHLASWDYLVRAYTDKSLPESIAFDFEPKTFHLEDAMGPKPGWDLVLFGSRNHHATTEQQSLADAMVKRIIQEVGLARPDQRPFVWFETEDLLCRCQDGKKKFRVNGKAMSRWELTNDYLSNGERSAMDRLTDSLED